MSSTNIHKMLSAETKAICKPLFESTDICYFHHGRIYRDGKTTCLDTSPRWHRCFMDNKHYKNADYSASTRSLTLVSAIPNFHKEAADMRTHCSLDHKFELAYKTDKYIDIFGFATRVHNDKIIEFYFNNLDLLQHFTRYFFDATQKLQSNLLSTGGYFHYPSYKKIFCDQPEKKKEKHDSLIFNNRTLRKASLSPQEYKVLLYLQKGYSSKDIARTLDVSSRTAESHIFRLKKRLNAYSKSQLIQDVKPLRTS